MHSGLLQLRFKLSKTMCFAYAPVPLPHDVGIANRWSKSTRLPRMTEVQGVGAAVRSAGGARVA